MMRGLIYILTRWVLSLPSLSFFLFTNYITTLSSILLSSTQPDFILNTPADLLSILRRYAPRGGLTVKTLRASWPGVNLAIEELEKQGKVLVSRTLGAGERNGFGGNGNALTSVAAEDVKEGQMKAVFLDEVGNEGKVDVG